VRQAYSSSAGAAAEVAGAAAGAAAEVAAADASVDCAAGAGVAVSSFLSQAANVTTIRPARISAFFIIITLSFLNESDYSDK
jgi:hypothetical protein